jgi:hypothetical protein
MVALDVMIFAGVAPSAALGAMQAAVDDLHVADPPAAPRPRRRLRSLRPDRRGR